MGRAKPKQPMLRILKIANHWIKRRIINLIKVHQRTRSKMQSLKIKIKKIKFSLKKMAN
jgi:hypothetical protein